MRLAFLVIALSFCAVALTWTKEDHEIFDLVSALEAAEGKGTSFYSHIGVSPSASTSEITKAYRKKSLELHPDKNPGAKNIQGRFERLGVIAQILRSPVDRDRYDFFFKNGVPTWRGTGYYYSRFRPTLFHTLLFLVFFTSGLHYLVMRLNYSRDRKRVDYFDRAAKSAAGVKEKEKEKDRVDGNKENGTSKGQKESVASKERRRKVKVLMVEGNEYGGSLELIVEGDEVFLPHDDGSLTPLSGLANPPRFTRTWPFLIVNSLVSRAVSALPLSTQSSLPPFLLLDAPILSPEEDGDDEPVTPAWSRTELLREKRRSRRSTPRDSPATTEVESEGSGEDGEENGAEGGQVNGDGKKKKRGPGKAGAMRRRKMALKR